MRRALPPSARIAALLLPLVLLALPRAARACPPEPADTATCAALTALSQRRLFFAHQGVGAEVLEGVAQALAAHPGVALRVVEVRDGATPLPPGTWAHARVGAEGQPGTKLAHLARLVDGGLGAQADVVLLKLSPRDFDTPGDARTLLAAYQATLEALRARHPHVTFVHLTVPLTPVRRGVRGWFKHLLGRPARGEEENVRREQFNALLRGAYAGREPLFDLARLQATAPDGTPVTFEAYGRTWPALAPAWAQGEEHLSPAGRAHLASHLLSFLAALPVPAAAGPALVGAPTP